MINMCEMTISELTLYINKKKISITELVQEYLKRIESLDQGENGLNSILEINPEIYDITARLDANINTCNSKLYGVPILLKDNITTADQLHTSAGSLALSDSISAFDADIVNVLRNKGAVILGKTNMTEFANYMTIGMPAGYSSRGGLVKSPYKKGADPSGSSTGSAVAVTTNLCMAAFGTDTSGSIISPAIKNSIIGFRPSMGVLSQNGLIPISYTLDTAGPMTRTVEDCIILMTELTGNIIPLVRKPDIPLVIGIDEEPLSNMNKEEAGKADKIMNQLIKLGYQLRRIKIYPLPAQKIKAIQRYEFKYAINRYLAGLPLEYPIRDLKTIIDFNNRHKKETLKYGQRLLIEAENTLDDLSEPEYLKIMRDRVEQKKQLMEQLKDVSFCIMFQQNLLMQYIGLPAITIPFGLYQDGTPYGFSLVGLDDYQLLQDAYHIEQAIGNRVIPGTS